MSTTAIRVFLLTCDVVDCVAEIRFHVLTIGGARALAAERGWVSRPSTLVTADFCPTHYDRVSIPAGVDTLRVFRDPVGDLAYLWPGRNRSDSRPSLYRMNTVDDAPTADGWVELFPGIEPGPESAARDVADAWSARTRAEQMVIRDAAPELASDLERLFMIVTEGKIGRAHR